MFPFSLERLLQFTNEALSAITVIVAGSMLLYYLSRNLSSPVARSSSVLLACVTVVSLVDVFASFDTTRLSLENWSRIQWLGIAFAPAAMFHLSDALLATTGLVSRGRRRRITRQLYILSGLFLIMALFTEALVTGLVYGPAPHLQAGPVFPVFVLYYIIATLVSVYNVARARNRCLSAYTHRRMGYLLFTFTLPSLGIFPYSLLFSNSSDSSLLFWLLVNLGNLGIILMLLFMAYPLSFFGSNIPDRVVKAELLRFFLRGPAAGSLVLLVILFVPKAGGILGLPSDQFMLFAAVAVVMFWQWMVSLALPYLERYLLYPDEQLQVRVLQSISQRLLTENDIQQLFEAILAAICDLLQVPVAFIAALNGEHIQPVKVVGEWKPQELLMEGGDLQALGVEVESGEETFIRWRDFWVVPLHSTHVSGSTLLPVPNGQAVIGLLAVQARAAELDLTPEERQVFDVLVLQAAQALDDQRFQIQVFTVLEQLLPEMDDLQRIREAARYRDFPTVALAQSSLGASGIQPEFVEAVRDALRDYWGGPRLTRSSLLTLKVVQQALQSNANNPTRALRAVLQDAVNRLRPAGERSMTQAEWTLYNIVDLRFIQGYKVRDVAKRLAMSEADLYRKQRTAIEEVARILAKIENESHI